MIALRKVYDIDEVYIICRRRYDKETCRGIRHDLLVHSEEENILENIITGIIEKYIEHKVRRSTIGKIVKDINKDIILNTGYDIEEYNDVVSSPSYVAETAIRLKGIFSRHIRVDSRTAIMMALELLNNPGFQRIIGLPRLSIAIAGELSRITLRSLERRLAVEKVLL
ncbi:MAG: hypothetical protein GSR86_05620 [Desulfurococcales archaeon]|nr:hypothetical protein [Desulfurococcales archaeon]